LKILGKEYYLIEPKIYFGVKFLFFALNFSPYKQLTVIKTTFHFPNVMVVQGYDFNETIYNLSKIHDEFLEKYPHYERIIDGDKIIFIDLINNKSGAPTDDRGKPVYISAGTAGQYDMNPPIGTGKVVRIIGHVINGVGGVGNAYLIKFNPDNTWIEL
jgi:hypothetical protein